ncbi:glucose-methanol-choline oxidoreductase [Emericellopsis atlantica]|uniref:Glucose-methanol-choline oxidoreductase n=1 Tax=Emericellopsis atlantica TaxID=2614577 RepID=A0A9P7ZH82_9HYPO|nr:glucose-methanol-choline oxidoreductase [Emericellopsis atlantica]KAG9252054.1 glucose-methanol-choline oxidoreductase [Emericellopsis atlantica]
MKLSASLVSLAALSGAAAQYVETLEFAGLIGSHFGVPGIPGAYDYVILGGGTAGLTMAKRLAEDKRYTVAVVEAGDFAEFANGNNSQIPALAASFIGSDPKTKNPYLDWYQWTTKQVGLGGRSVVYMSGKVLGGGSVRNFMWYHRASKAALDKWAELTGDESYSFENMLPYYKKSAEFTPPHEEYRLDNATTLYDEDYWSSDGGPLQVGYPNWANPISSWIARGLEYLGLENLPGFADGNLDGYAYTAFSLDSETQTRSSSSSSFLRAGLRDDTNLNVYKNTMAKKILFDDDKNAIGAVVESGGVEYQLSASREVIVSAGAFRSPQLLMVSGIGPEKTLKKVGIKVISNLKGVGQNMWDHIAFSPSYVVNLLTHSAMSRPDFAVEQLTNYQTQRTGQLTNCGGDVLGFARFPKGAISTKLRKELDKFSADWPDYEHLFLDGYFGYANDITDGPTDGRQYVSSSTALTNPFSRGTVTISSNDTNDYPIVDPNWLGDPRDQEIAVAAFQRARAVFGDNEGTRDIVIGEEVFPGLNVSSYDEVLEHIQKSAQASFHASCTCAMGRKKDPMAVLDSQARVYGVNGLRVVDASAFPVLSPGHPTATVYALAEKIADAILRGSSPNKPKRAPLMGVRGMRL